MYTCYIFAHVCEGQSSISGVFLSPLPLTSEASVLTVTGANWLGVPWQTTELPRSAAFTCPVLGTQACALKPGLFFCKQIKLDPHAFKTSISLTYLSLNPTAVL